MSEVIVLSEPRIVSPMLDHFNLGGSISCHSGVNCYPAMREDSEERYIVKTISIPASQVQLDALLLTGAYPNAEAAREYFKELAKGIRSEIEILDRLAARRGFLPFLDSQIVPMERGVGYEIYLLNYYKRTLERHLKKEPLTHLSAVNLGIDLCAALALCREEGYLYVDLKPSNIFIDTKRQAYHLGDLGFVALDSLKYASLPDRYRSDYTSPEVSDAMSTLNDTMDTYALGLVLYQIYNNGALPFSTPEEKEQLMAQLSAGEPLPPPCYADYELSEIICQACAYAPENRYQTPTELAQALIGYMKRNGVNDVPIGPPAMEEVPEAEEASDPESPEVEDAPTQDDQAPEEAPEDAGETAESQEEAPPSGDWIDRMDAILSEDQPDGESAESSGEEEPSLRELLQDEDTYTPAQDGDAPVNPEELSDETASFLNQVQDLIDHEAPGPAVAPEPIDVPIPEPIVLPEEEEADKPPLTMEELQEGLFRNVEDDAQDEDAQDDDLEQEDLPPAPKGKVFKRILTTVMLLLLLAAGAYGGYYYYETYYIQRVDGLTVDGQADSLTVLVDTAMDQSLLTVVCKDTYGNLVTQPLVDGKAVFDQLQPGSQYTITLEIDGFHQLMGPQSALFSTPERTQIVDLTAVTGAEDGSVILSFGVEGPESEEWTLTCSTDGESDRTISFTGHNCTVTGLTPFATYTFTLTGGEDVYLIGESTLRYTVSTVVYAQNLTVTGYREDSMTVVWDAPEGVSVNSWTARCYNEDGFDQVLVVTESSATFTGTSSDSPYTLEITAEGMTQSMRTFITKNPVTITDVELSVGDNTIDVSWSFEGNEPESGWLVLYTVDKGTEQQVIESSASHVTIAPAAPGSHYDIVIQSADATTVFGGTAEANVPAASGDFSGYGLRSTDIEVSLYVAPQGSWSRTDLKGKEKTTSFAPGDGIALVYYTDDIYNLSNEALTTLIVVRDWEGRLATISSHTRSWNDMWSSGYCEEELPQLPSTPGDYTLSIYINGKVLTSRNIQIHE